MKTPKLAMLVGMGTFLCQCNLLLGQGTPLFMHSGGINPTTEGFTLFQSGSPSLNPVFSDQGYDAWHVGLPSASDFGFYYANLSAQQVADAANGWVLSLTLRLLPPSQSPSYGVFSEFSTGVKRFSLLFGTQPNGDPSVRLGNTVYTLAEGGAGYHNYQLRFDAELASATLWIDGIQRLTGLNGADAFDTPRFSWGGAQHPAGSYNVNWNEASFTIVPEPSALALLALGGAWLAAMHRRRFKP